MRKILKDQVELLQCLLAVEEARNAYLQDWIGSLERIDEDGLDDQRIKDATARIDDLRRESERQRLLIRAMKDRLRRKRDLERLRKSKERTRKLRK